MNILDFTDDETLKKFLIKHYKEDYESATDIGKKLGISGPSVLRYLKKFHIVVRKKSAPRLGARDSGLHNIPLEDWRLGIAGVANKYKLDYTAVYNFYKRYKRELDGALRDLRRRSGNY